MVATAVRALGRLDILVNNAGVGYWESIANADIDTWESESRVCIANIFVIPSVPEKETAFRDEALHRHNEKDQ
jgi:NAD(P)-dependent dehydrogenase (short-subunit alcohol dehydrogenase family)